MPEQSAEKQSQEKTKTFISLRVKLLVGFTLIFAIVFAVAFYWFYSFATQQAMNRIQSDLHDTLLAAAKGTNTDELMALYRDGEPNDEGFSDDPRYENQLNWLQTIHDIEPRAWPYNYIKGDDATPVIYVADLWYRYDKSKAVKFLEAKTSKGQSYQGFSDLHYREGYPYEETFDSWCSGSLFASVAAAWCEDYGSFPLASLTGQGFNTYSDEWGRWVSAYAPVYDSSGEAVAAVGVDFEADYVDEVQKGIADQVFVAFAVTYTTLFILIYLFSRALTAPIIRLTASARAIGEGDYEQDLTVLQKQNPDEIDTLAQVFQIMVDKVYQREQTLRRQVQELQIIVDETKKKQQVDEIAESEFFRDLQAKAKNIRSRRQDK